MGFACKCYRSFFLWGLCDSVVELFELQVLFFEQVRTAMSGGLVDLPQNVRALLPHSQEIAFTEANGSMSPGRTVDENWETVHEDFKVLKGDLAAMKIRLAEAEKERGGLQAQQQPSKNLKSKSGFPLFRPKKLLNRLFPGLLGDYSKRPVIGSLPGKRTNPYSIPWVKGKMCRLLLLELSL